jgi:hypothetical protein
MCPGYVRAIAGLPDETSKPAAEGTAAHHVSESCLALGMDAHDFIGKEITVEGFTFEWTETDADLLQYGIDAVRALGGEFYGERRVDLSRWLGPDQFGTLDRAVLTDELIVINDLKWGRVPVSPVRNPQLALYALGFWWEIARHKTDCRNFKLAIDQPRSAGGGGEWDVTLDELLAFGESSGAAAQASRMPNAPLIAGSWCRYCPAAKQKGGCRALDAFNLEVLGIAPDTLDAGEVPAPLEEVLTPERRGFLLLFRPQLKAWLDKIDEDALTDALAGYKIPLMKPVMGRRPARKWKDDETAEQKLCDELGDEAIERKVKTPAKIEKMLGKTEFADRFDSLVDLGEAKPILVPDDDARPELQNYAKLIDQA